MRFYVLVLVFLFGSGCSVSNQQSIAEEGALVVEKYENGEKKSEGHILGDRVKTETYDPIAKSYGSTVTSPRKVGVWIYWHENGQEMMKGSYKNGKKQGRWTLWHDNGEKGGEGTYENDEENGRWTLWHDNGEKFMEETYKNGQKEGPWAIWHANGQKTAEGTLKNGEPEGILTRWYANGNKQEERTYKNGKKDGRCSAWHEDESINAELSGIYKDGKKISNQE